jgi:hypothetical protein
MKNKPYVFQEASVINAIKNCITKYSGEVKITDNYFFNMKKTVNLITLYSANKFESGDTDENGNKKYFFNVLNPLCDNAAKNIDIDRKNIEIKPKKTSDRIQAQIYNTELSNYMEHKKFGLLLNDIITSLPRDGSVVLEKELDGSIAQTELRYVLMDPAVSNKKGNYDIQSSFYLKPVIVDIQEFDEMATRGWNQEAVDAIRTRIMTTLSQGPTQVPDIKIYKCYMILPNSLFEEGATGYDNYLILCTINGNDTLSLGIEKVLYFAKGVKLKAKKVDYRTIVGRALGLGLMEAGFDAQERFNEMQNQLAQTMRNISKTNWQTRDKNVAANILTDTLDGDVIKLNSELTLVPNEKRDLASFNANMQQWMENLRMNAQANEVLTGETMPSDTPYRTVQQLSVAAGKFFDLVRENLALFLNDVITEWIIPDFEKELKKKDYIMVNYTSDIWRELVAREVEARLDKAVLAYARAKKKFPTNEEINIERQRLIDTASKDFMLNIDDNFFDFDKYLFIDISGEKSNIQRQTESLINALTMIVQNPAALTNPIIWKVFSAILENTGVSLDIVNNQIPPATPTSENTPNAGATVPTAAESARNLSMAPGGTESVQMNNQINA